MEITRSGQLKRSTLTFHSHLPKTEPGKNVEKKSKKAIYKPENICLHASATVALIAGRDACTTTGEDACTIVTVY